MGRYTLRVYDNKTRKEQIVKILENGKYKNKLDITTIDIFLLENARYGLANDEMLKDEEIGKNNVINYLNSSIDNDNPCIKSKLSNDSIIYITYEASGRKYLEPIYKSDNLLNIAREFDVLRKRFLQYKKQYPKASKDSLEKKYDEIFNSIKKEPFFNSWLRMFYNDLKTRNVSHYVSSDKKYLNSYLKKAIMNLIFALPYENADIETNEANKRIRECKEDIEKYLIHYKQMRGIIILRDKYWDRLALVEQHRESKVPFLKDNIGSRDVAKAIRLKINNTVVKKNNIEMENVKNMQPSIKKIEIENDGIVNTINAETGKLTYLDHFDELYEEKMMEEQSDSYLDMLNSTEENIIDDPDIVRTTLNGKSVYIDHGDENAWAKRKKR